MLIGREADLNFLEHYYELEESQIVVVYGQKNIGKTALLKQFGREKKGSYYLARAASGREQRYQWAAELKSQGFELPQYPGYQEIFRCLAEPVSSKQLIVLDEFHHMVKGDAEFMDELIRFVEDRGLLRPVLVVLCTSASGWVENSMVRKIGGAAFYLNGLLKLKELKFEDIHSLFPGFAGEGAVEAYAVLGGIPGLWKSFDDQLTIRENMIRHILTRESRLYEEMSVLIADQLREPAVYNTILAAMAGGCNKLNEIYLRTGFSRAKISVYLKNLMELELVEKVFSFETAGRANAQKGIYRISNPFVRFYFRYLYSHQSLLQQLDPEEFYERVVRASFREFAEEAFKKICREYLEKLRREGSLQVDYTESGEWVGKNGNLDFVARNGAGNTLAAVCSYGKKISEKDYEWVLFCAGKARIKPDVIYLFSAEGFEDGFTASGRIPVVMKTLVELLRN